MYPICQAKTWHPHLVRAPAVSLAHSFLYASSPAPVASPVSWALVPVLVPMLEPSSAAVPALASTLAPAPAPARCRAPSAAADGAPTLAHSVHTLPPAPTFSYALTVA